MAFLEANNCLKKDSTKIATTPAKCARENQLSRICKIIIFYIALFDVAQAASNSKCHPLDLDSCGFGGECISVSTFPYGVDFDPSEYRCRCNFIRFDLYGYEPVCGSDGM